jgi:hypothetical protein
MLQAKFSVKESQARFLNKYKDYGFKDKSTMLRVAIDQFKKNLELEQLKQSADLYAEDYSGDNFHLALNDTSALDAGTDLSADGSLAFSDDIDGQERIGAWDIGADEGL